MTVGHRPADDGWLPGRGATGDWLDLGYEEIGSPQIALDILQAPVDTGFPGVGLRDLALSGNTDQ
jgi:hypothetical protein